MGDRQQNSQYVPTPLFTMVDNNNNNNNNNSGGMSSNAQHAVSQRGNPVTFNLDAIFGDVAFTPNGDTVFLSEQQDYNNYNHHYQQQQQQQQSNMIHYQHQPSGEGDHVSPVASRLGPDGQHYNPVPQGGGLYTTQLTEPSKPALQMGSAGPNVKPTAPVPFKAPVQKQNHLQYVATGGGGVSSSSKKRKASGGPPSSTGSVGPSGSSVGSIGGGRPSDRKMSEQQKIERRERNREHAKRSRIRKKFLLESLQQSVVLLKEENEKLRNALRTNLGTDKANELIKAREDAAADAEGDGLLATSNGLANKVLDDPDFSFIKALQTAQQNFVVTDPSLPDNPIVYASQGFLNLTGYTLDQILGRNCRFLQGPETDPKAVERIRHAIERGEDMSVCLLNYRVDGTTFWNQFFIAPLRDADGNVTNFVGVQCKVSDQYAATVIKQQEEEMENAAAGDGGNGDDQDDPNDPQQFDPQQQQEQQLQQQQYGQQPQQQQLQMPQQQQQQQLDQDGEGQFQSSFPTGQVKSAPGM